MVELGPGGVMMNFPEKDYQRVVQLYHELYDIAKPYGTWREVAKIAMIVSMFIALILFQSSGLLTTAFIILAFLFFSLNSIEPGEKARLRIHAHIENELDKFICTQLVKGCPELSVIPVSLVIIPPEFLAQFK